MADLPWRRVAQLRQGAGLEGVPGAEIFVLNYDPGLSDELTDQFMLFNLTFRPAKREINQRFGGFHTDYTQSYIQLSGTNHSILLYLTLPMTVASTKRRWLRH